MKGVSGREGEKDFATWGEECQLELGSAAALFAALGSIFPVGLIHLIASTGLEWSSLASPCRPTPPALPRSARHSTRALTSCFGGVQVSTSVDTSETKLNVPSSPHDESSSDGESIFRVRC